MLFNGASWSRKLSTLSLMSNTTEEAGHVRLSVDERRARIGHELLVIQLDPVYGIECVDHFFRTHAPFEDRLLKERSVRFRRIIRFVVASRETEPEQSHCGYQILFHCYSVFVNLLSAADQPLGTLVIQSVEMYSIVVVSSSSMPGASPSVMPDWVEGSA